MSNLLPLPGFCFDPSDYELLNFLLRKINDKPLPVCPRMPDANIYGDHPSQVFDSFGQSDFEEEDTVRYFFTELQPVSKKKGVITKNVIRRVGGYGYWKNAVPKPIMVKNNQGEYVKVGSRTSLKFIKDEAIVDDHVEWSMIEISTHDSNWVLCKITKKILKQVSNKRQLQCQETSSSIISTNSATTTVADDGVQGNAFLSKLINLDFDEPFGFVFNN
ncbi:NAC domain-containing protein 2-like [Spinacia oleracea]|uniref:NAC domain-containing protein 2-like n=1 Tax=Spinacia oleracea TaxID=3562 RepID=A0A9R0JQN7_SPIOL|nr:NAC domain-containing protein 2-like [Spinacia oleracea]